MLKDGSGMCRWSSPCRPRGPARLSRGTGRASAIVPCTLRDLAHTRAMPHKCQNNLNGKVKEMYLLSIFIVGQRLADDPRWV